MQNALRIGNINLKKRKKKSIKDDKRYTNPMWHISLKIGTSLGGVDEGIEKVISKYIVDWYLNA